MNGRGMGDKAIQNDLRYQFLDTIMPDTRFAISARLITKQAARRSDPVAAHRPFWHTLVWMCGAMMMAPVMSSAAFAAGASTSVVPSSGQAMKMLHTLAGRDHDQADAGMTAQEFLVASKEDANGRDDVAPAGNSGPNGGFETIEALGKALYFDTSLSKNRTESCASCHDPNFAFRDPRDAAGGSVSLGDDGHSLGTRNAPMAAYAMFSPKFHFNKDGVPVGGQFWDGRADDLAMQASMPPLNPAEMGMPDKATIIARLEQNDAYVQAFRHYFGNKIWDDADGAYQAMTRAIAAFERTGEFATFDSKYDRWLAGTYKMTPKEELGRVLFFSQQFTNCNACHELKAAGEPRETFTNYQYHNIGVPQNRAMREANGLDPDFVDNGLLDNPNITDAKKYKGLYKVPSLRNVAVTGPYMHNGVFKDLRTVVKFYNKYNSRAKSAQINPETGKHWGKPEVPGTISITELEKGDALDSRRIDAIVAFLETLTDKRYEPLLKEQKAERAREKAKAQKRANAAN
jgi:cytochrome c peroxidase